MTLLATSIPPVSKEFYEKITAAFPRLDVEPNITTMDEIMFNTGTQRVLEWIKVHALQVSVVTNADVTKTINTRAR